MKLTQESVQKETVEWIKRELQRRNKPLVWLSSRIGMEPSAFVRTVNLGRELKYNELIKIAEVFQKKPPLWDRVDNVNYGNFLPLYGKTSSGVWREKGTDMPTEVAPFGPMLIGEGADQQFCYQIGGGPRAGQYAICIGLLKGFIRDGEFVIAEEEKKISATSIKLVRTTLRRIETVEGETRFMMDGEEGAPLIFPAKNVRVRGCVIGFLGLSKVLQGM